MAPMKRSRRVVDDDEEEGIGNAREGRPSPRPTDSRKRVRVSLDDQPKEPTPQAYESPDSESDDETDRDRPDSPPQTQYELMRDAGFRHLENTDLDDQRATQKLRHRPTNLGNNMVSEGGIIESITCVNFMCHTRLHVELGPLINFIVGENGSGKSAVLTALTLCLGGKASDTNRGGSLKSFVKEGTDQGTLTVKIKNAGSDAYMPEVYGDSIIVERHFSKTGASGFKVKSSMGRIISTKKQEVDEISEWYALQIGNPLTVLSQDNARQFLNSATPAQKYKYFVSGVQLEQLDNDYKMSQDTLDKTLILRDDLTSKIDSVKKEMEDAQRLAETAQKNQSLREKARHYRNQLVWSQVVEQERLLKEREGAIGKRDTAIAEAEIICEEMSQALTTAEEKLVRVRQAREDLETDRGTFEDRINEAEAAYHAARKEVQDLHREERDAHGRLKTIKDGISSCESKIKDEERRLGESTGSARAEKDNELAKATAKEKALEGDHDESTQQLPRLQARLVEAEQASRKIQLAKDTKKKEIVAAESQVRELESRTGSAFDGFDKDMGSLVKAVQSERGFDQKPVGPIGAHVRLSKPEWSGILEKTLGDALNAFIVTSKSDQSRLSNIMRRVGMNRPPPIYIAYTKSINTSSQEPDVGFDTILRVLQFDDELVRSQLVINNQIEKIVLIQERTEAQRVMVDNTPPRNVSACICFHDGKGKRGHGLRITNRGGSIGTSPIQPWTQRPRMQTDSARQVDLQKENLVQLGLEMREIMSEDRQATQTLQRRKTELDNHRKSIKDIENRRRRIQAEMERIAMELDGFEGADDRLVVLRAELESKRCEEEQIGSQYGAMRLAKRDLNTKSEDAKRRLDLERGEREDFQAKVNKAEEKIKTHETLRRLTLAKKNEAFERVDIEKGERRRAVQKRDEKASEVADFIGQAREMAPDRVHIPDDETHNSIEKKYEKVREQLAQRERRLGATDQQIYDRATETRKRYEDVMKQTRDVDDTISSLKRAIEQRLHLWRQFQRQISARIRIQFNYLLSERGFRGKIDLDHRARKVQIQIEPDETRKSAAGRNTKTLSGGEKSFSSICMLLSVWEAIGSPIRCLDEFDVFMDNVNRAISTNMLVDAARRSVSRQYILITPNAIEGRARLDKDVKIIRYVKCIRWQ
ncbi:P-loop containing nucleoside triphosphate hydrolase protein [Dactylonectria macrodidyma]|uniref:P-loop containing nucleoside triphosphate hydrolase protein n=1 Tax=Dactylonectria macrodidyma TaxID=307937 RepID=A0A9P9JAS8_9HYPO|nr:P-loop containing nucleoside triphosphate hydrolase protein [Dactylonectria macrodidyma]